VGTIEDELQHFEECQARNSTLFIAPYLILRAQMDYLLGQPQSALEFAKVAEKRLGDIPGVISIAQDNFYYSLSLLSLYPTLSSEQQVQALCQLETLQQRLRNWADNCPENFQHKYDLVEAETARVLGHFEQAAKGYEKAIVGARENKYLQEEALSYELAAKFYLSHGMEKFAQTYLQEASYHYQLWGATAKVQHLQTQYPQRLIKQRLSEKVTTSFYTQMSPTNTTLSSIKTTGSQELDLNSIIKASQTLSGEIVLHRLLEKMMYIVIENAGAGIGYLLLPQQEQWFIEARGTVGQQTTAVLQSLPIEDNRLVSAAVIHYVIRTQQLVTLDDATKIGNFTQDAHIVQAQVKSLLCLPLKHQGKLIGILYLENNLATGAFTSKQLETLNLLSSQLAVSIENALLYANLERKVEERTHELAEKNEKLVQLNQEKNEFLGIAAHDLKNPLSAILGLSDMIVEDVNELPLETISEFAGHISTSAKQMFDLIVNLLDVNQIESGKFKIFWQSVDLFPLVQKILENYRGRATDKQIQLHYQATQPCIAQLDLNITRQILDNLISNAVKYSPFNRNIYVRIIETETFVCCEIQDEGPGLTETDRQKLFGKFARLTAQPTKGEHSTGLGLFIVKKLVTAMNGQVWCESELGKGATFIVKFNKT